MSDVLLSVRPAGGGWLLDCLDGLDPMQFASAAEAQEQANLLANCLARAGVDVRVLVLDGAQQLVNSTTYSPGSS